MSPEAVLVYRFLRREGLDPVIIGDQRAPMIRISLDAWNRKIRGKMA